MCEAAACDASVKPPLSQRTTILGVSEASLKRQRTQPFKKPDHAIIFTRTCCLIRNIRTLPLVNYIAVTVAMSMVQPRFLVLRA